MKIVFICGSLQPGSDGVGDYVLRLSNYLRSHDIECICVSLDDRYITHSSCTYSVIGSSIETECIRLSSRAAWADKAVILQRLIDGHHPDWISLQYVPHAFNSKGLPLSLLRCLTSLRTRAKWHVMAHELWLDSKLHLKNTILSSAQQGILKFVLQSLKPQKIHTSNEYYCNQLSSCGFPSEVLPLFSNISVNMCLVDYDIRPSHLSFVLFGSIHPGWDPRDLISSIKLEANRRVISAVELRSIGFAGEHGRTLWSDLAASTPAWISFKQFGPMTPTEISHQLHQANFGITTTPSHLIGKSGSVAAMLAHGLPVIVPRLEKINGPWHTSLKADRRFVLLDSDFSDSLRLARKMPPKDQLDDTGQRFLRSLMRFS